MSPSATPSAQAPSASVGPATLATSRVGFPCCSLFRVGMPSPTTLAKRVGPDVRCSIQPVPAFPQVRQGRPSHRDFRGRLGIHSRYSLPTCRQPLAASFLRSSDRFVASATAGIATRPGRPLPGQDSHLLDQRAFLHGAPGPLHCSQSSSGLAYSSAFFRTQRGSPFATRLISAGVARNRAFFASSASSGFVS